MNEEQWSPTRFGGFRRTGLAQKTTEEQEATGQPASSAERTGDGVAGGSEVWPEHRSDKAEVGGSNPSPRTDSWGRKVRREFVFKHEELGMPECPYVIRWRAECPWFSVRLHKWLSPDDDRAPHDHPWNFTTLVLKGGYNDKSPSGNEHLRAPAIRRRSALHQHTVFPDRDGAWTVIVCGHPIRNWGFWVNGKFRKANKYFFTHGHHPCDSESEKAK